MSQLADSQWTEFPAWLTDSARGEVMIL